MEKRHAIIGSSTRLFGSIGFDATSTLEIADEADVMMSLNHASQQVIRGEKTVKEKGIKLWDDLYQYVNTRISPMDK